MGGGLPHGRAQESYRTLNCVSLDGRLSFISENTRRVSPPLVPQIILHLADACVPIWRATEDALERANVPPPYWAFAWAGGQALARYMLDNPALAAGKHVLDLGAGSGLSGIAAKMSGAANVLAADIDRFAEAAIRLNAESNNVSVETTTDDLLRRPLARFDAILVGDLFYERELAERVLARVAEAAARGALVLAGDPRRSYFPANRFQRLAEYAVPVSRDLEDSDLKPTGVYRLAEGR